MAPRVGCQPRLRQIQDGPEHPRAGARPQGRGHGDLAIGHLAQRATVLARHADRVCPLFGETRRIEDQHPLALGDDHPQLAPDAVGAPGRLRDEVLKGLDTCPGC